MVGSTPSFNHRYIYLLGIFYGFSQEVSTMALAISYRCKEGSWKHEEKKNIPNKII
jgi:hypothetical protein